MRIDLKFETDNMRIEMHWSFGSASSYSTYVNVLDLHTGRHAIMSWSKFLERLTNLSEKLI